MCSVDLQLIAENSLISGEDQKGKNAVQARTNKAVIAVQVYGALATHQAALTNNRLSDLSESQAQPFLDHFREKCVNNPREYEQRTNSTYTTLLSR